MFEYSSTFGSFDSTVSVVSVHVATFAVYVVSVAFAPLNSLYPNPLVPVPKSLLYLNDIGSSGSSLYSIWKCRCGPVEFPVFPDKAINCPFSTTSPTDTFNSLLCIYLLVYPFPWSISIQFPAELLFPAFITVPCSQAYTFVPSPTPISIPL